MTRARRHACTDRGFTMAIVLAIVVLLLLAGIAMLTNAQATAIETRLAEQKNLAFDAADAGLNSVMDSLDGSLANMSQTGTMPTNGYKYSTTGAGSITASGPQTVRDPESGNTVTIPANSVIINSVGSPPGGGRTSTVEAVVKTSQTTLTFSNDAVDAGLDVQGNWNHKIGVKESSSGAKDANVHANHNITANAGFVNGSATASGTVTGNINANSTQNNAPQVNIPLVAPYVAQAKTIAQGGGNNLYINPKAGGSMPTSYSCPPSALPNGCIIFYDGAFSMAGQTALNFSGRVILVINGDYQSTGKSSLTMQTGSHSLLVVNGNADLGGNGSAAALIWAADDVTLHGNGYDTGAVVAQGNVNFQGGGNGGGIQKDATLAGTQVTENGKVQMKSYAEY